MGRQLTIGNPPIDVELRRSARARRLSLRVSRLDGRVTLTIPKRGSEREAIGFLRERESWLRGHVGAVAPITEVRIGASIPIAGQLVPIHAGQGRRAVLKDGVLLAPATDTGRRVQAFLKLLARDRLAAASDTYAAAVGKPYDTISLRDTRSRWGSCSSRGGLMYSWRLVMAPPAVLDYVAAHECAHLVEMNHSSAFWSVVAGLMPDYAQHRAWLRENGDQLHRVSFDG
ncbi:hypothetical protein SAMN04488515_2056 [Cognatiyoonia koreensis]|uniref:YgjP-like metallopeptidase domain-containing protein n=1 Tax=Cognatiyoonia koreensis TaxID=364200 RepID=A0A1I0QQA3_9RHOB|nr:SprT family zinc-dependent metalloprotease [Cognatiyoonia koreensis]SEW29029.1 hypothetical protein SAMN04488515_2056 [Cognatiyoonia koreensis]